LLRQSGDLFLPSAPHSRAYGIRPRSMQDFKYKLRFSLSEYTIEYWSKDSILGVIIAGNRNFLKSQTGQIQKRSWFTEDNLHLSDHFLIDIPIDLLD